MGFDMARIRVAILGAGRIAQHMADTLVKMAEDVRYADLMEPYAVAARNAVRAADFAAKYGFPVSYGSYEELVADPNVDLVYIATPHNLHAEQAILCMKAGKGVLVEKAFGANAAQTREMLAVAKETGMLCAEAIWTRYMRPAPLSIRFSPPVRLVKYRRSMRTCVTPPPRRRESLIPRLPVAHCWMLAYIRSISST